MAQTTLRSGTPRTVQYTPSGGDVTAGDVILLGNTTGLTCGIAATDITNNTQGTLYVGGGVHTCVNLNNAADGTKVYWDNTNDKVTTTSTNNALFGFVAEDGGGGANTNCGVLHHPYV